MKKLESLKGAKVLNKEEQKCLKGGVTHCDATHPCPKGLECIQSFCWLTKPGVEVD